MNGIDPNRPSDPNPPDWRTPSERDDYRTTPSYAETLAFLQRLETAHPRQVRIETFGTTGEGRELKAVVVSKDGTFDPASARASGRAVVLVQNSIHAGEPDGKDASLELLRDLVRRPERASLLERVVVVLVPVYNVDGHERRSHFSRINQNGPEEVGWRGNGRNLNLNRDYLKADAPETRAFLRLFARWLPDFFVDNHVTDGADFQYEVTFALDATPDVDPLVADWIRGSAVPELVQRLEAAGHPTFPAGIFLKDETDPSKGLALHDNPPRFSTGLMILENRPGLLVEMHMLKAYRARVRANYELMVALLTILNRDADRLLFLVGEADRTASRLGSGLPHGPPFALALESNGETASVNFRGYGYSRGPSPVSGTLAIQYTREPQDLRLPMDTGVRVALAVSPPAGYIVPPSWTDVTGVLEAHGVTIRRTRSPWAGTVGRYHLSGFEWPSTPFEGRHPILRAGNVEPAVGRFGRCELRLEPASYPVGSAVISLAQRQAKVVMHWLEPEAPDSAVRWGFFGPIFEQKETAEPYVMEALAPKLLEEDVGLRRAFDERVRDDPEFAKDPQARLSFLYLRSPWGRSNRVGEYPVGRLNSLDDLPV